MNAPFKPDDDEVEEASETSVSISGLKKSPAAVIAAARRRQVAILSRGKRVAYVISPEVWERLTDVYQDMKDVELVHQLLQEDDDGIEVTLEQLRAGFPEEGEEAVEQARHDDPDPAREETR